MPDARTCPACGSERPPRATEGPCPGCLLRDGLAGGPPSFAPAGAAGATIDWGGSRVLETLAATAGPVPRVLLRDTDGAEPPVIRPADPAGADASVRYRIDGEIARGGMGAVLKGRDPDLGRDVAVKVLRDDLRDRPEMVRRFVEEAQIGGQLQHPGIVPVYELGAFADRRPYFAMKLVKGQTLAVLLAGRPSPAEGLPRFLGIFEQVAQTVAYAHARGVIHRDLKPSNVMVGSFGEVQVMDWGLAKVLPPGGAADDPRAGREPGPETVVVTARSGGDSDVGLSHAGSVLGTPGYMAPEQARGEIDAVDERADVFALGSILCEVLTGAPAFTGRTSGAILLKATRADTADALARLGGSGTDAELVALARDCLAAQPGDRPRDARAVADRVTAYLAGVQERLRRAELARVEERARRRLTTWVAVAGVLAGVGFVIGMFASHRAGRRESTALAEYFTLAAERLARAAGGERGDPSSWDDAFEAAEHARNLLGRDEANAAMRRVDGLVAEITAARHAAPADRRLLTELEAVRGAASDSADRGRADAAYAAAFRAAGLDLDAAGAAAAGAWVRGRTDPRELTAALDDWTYVRRRVGRPEADWRRLVAAARAADPDPWRDALRAKVAARDESALATFRALADDAAALEGRPAASLVLLAGQLRDVGDRERAEAVLRRAWRRFPGDFWVNFQLARAPGRDAGEARDRFPRPAEAIRYLTAAVAIRPGSAAVHKNLGIALEASGDRAGAIAAYREALRLSPNDAEAHNNLALTLLESGDPTAALDEVREALRLDPDDPRARGTLACALVARGRFHEASLRSLPEAERADWRVFWEEVGRRLMDVGPTP